MAKSLGSTGRKGWSDEARKAAAATRSAKAAAPKAASNPRKPSKKATEERARKDRVSAARERNKSAFGDRMWRKYD